MDPEPFLERWSVEIGDARLDAVVEGSGPVMQGDDGVVKYSSAHIEPVESELVVRSSHSTQGHPATIEEVRRILRLRTDAVSGRRDSQ